MTDVLDLGMRRRIYALVQGYPGIHVREAARQLDTSMALIEYHVAVLEQHGLVMRERDDNHIRLYASASTPAPADRAKLGVLRERLPLQVSLYLLDRGEGVAHGRIAQDLGMGKSKLSFHLRKLEAAGIVRKQDDGQFALIDGPGLQRLLLEHEPTPELRRDFADVWLKLYGD